MAEIADSALQTGRRNRILAESACSANNERLSDGVMDWPRKVRR
jgi:hypothetical protein